MRGSPLLANGPRALDRRQQFRTRACALFQGRARAAAAIYQMDGPAQNPPPALQPRDGPLYGRGADALDRPCIRVDFYDLGRPALFNGRESLRRGCDGLRLRLRFTMPCLRERA